MAAKKNSAGKGDFYELKHPHGGFDDFETGLTINREEQVQIDLETAGKATLAAIQAGRLVIVREVKEAAA